MSNIGARSLAKLIESTCKKHNLAGIVVGVTGKHHTQFGYSHGFSNCEERIPMDTDALFRIGSITKCLVASAVLRLVDLGKVDLDMPVSTMMSTLPKHHWLQKSRVTPRMLLSHTSGLPQDASVFGPRNPESLKAFVISDIPTFQPIFPPGVAMQYSNLGYCILGHMLESVCQRDFNEVMGDLVFRPLMMTRSTFDPLVAMTHKVASPHRKNARHDYETIHDPIEDTRFHPAGYAFSTIEDLQRFLRMLLSGGQSDLGRFLSKESVSEACRVQSKPFLTRMASYGLGFEINTPKNRVIIEHHGSISTYRSLISFLPERGIGVAILTNGETTHKHLDEIRDAILNKHVGSPSPVLKREPSEPLPNVSGSYVGEQCGVVSLSTRGGQLTAKWNREIIRLKRIADFHFVGFSVKTQLPLEIGFPRGFSNPTIILINGTMVSLRSKPVKFRVLKSRNNLAGTFASQFDVISVRSWRGGLFLQQKGNCKAFECLRIGKLLFASHLGVLAFASNHDSFSIGLLNYRKLNPKLRDPL